MARSIVATDNSLLDATARRLNLSNQQRIYADAYLSSGFNQEQACQVANYKNKSVGNRTFLLPKVQEYLHVAVRDSMKRLEIDKDSVIRVLADVAFMDATTLYCELTNEPIPLSELTKQQRNAIKDVKTIAYKDPETKKRITEVVGYTLHDKSKALDMLCKHFGIFEADNNQTRAIINQQINVKWN